MKQLGLIENSGMLKFRIETIIDKRSDMIIRFIKSDSSEIENVYSELKGVELLIIDLDNLEFKLDQLILEIQKRKEYKDLPIILIASKPKKAMIIELAKIGNLEVLLKPFNDLELLSKILKHKEAPKIKDIKLPEKEGQGGLLKWDVGYEIGVELIDAEHKLILENFEKLYQDFKAGKGRDTYGEILAFLEEYISSHFSHEENFQKIISYPLGKEHKEFHEGFKTQIMKIVTENKERTFTNQEVLRLILFIKEWIVHHILIEDKKMGTFIEEKLRESEQ